MQTTTRSWCKPIVVHASTNTGRPTDHYRSLLPPHGGSSGAYSKGGEERCKDVPLETAV